MPGESQMNSGLCGAAGRYPPDSLHSLTTCRFTPAHRRITMMNLNFNQTVQQRLRGGAGTLAIVLLMLSSVSAQSFKATVVGRIMDANGALIPGATVTIVERETGRTLTATSNDEGNFTITQVPPGNYEVRVEASNFKRSVQTGLVLENDQTQRIDMTLEAGNVREMVTVVATRKVNNNEPSTNREVHTNSQEQEMLFTG